MRSVQLLESIWRQIGRRAAMHVELRAHGASVLLSDHVRDRGDVVGFSGVGVGGRGEKKLSVN